MAHEPVVQRPGASHSAAAGAISFALRFIVGRLPAKTGRLRIRMQPRPLGGLLLAEFRHVSGVQLARNFLVEHDQINGRGAENCREQPDQKAHRRRDDRLGRGEDDSFQAVDQRRRRESGTEGCSSRDGEHFARAR